MSRVRFLGAGFDSGIVHLPTQFGVSSSVVLKSKEEQIISLKRNPPPRTNTIYTNLKFHKEV